MHLFIFANFTAKIIKTFGLKLYYPQIRNRPHKMTQRSKR